MAINREQVGEQGATAQLRRMPIRQLVDEYREVVQNRDMMDRDLERMMERVPNYGSTNAGGYETGRCRRLAARASTLSHLLGDLIEQETVDTQAGSTGGARIEYNPINRRVRGWATTGADLVVVRPGEGRALLERAVEEAYSLHDANDSTRITLRTVATDERLVQGIRGMTVEASVPLGDRHPGLSILYLGHNEPERNTDEATFAAQQASLQELLQRGRSNNRHGNVEGQYRISRLRNPSIDDVQEIISVMQESYSRDGRNVMWYTPTVANVYRVLNGAVTSVARNERGMIVSMCIAERASGLQIDGEPLTMYEISDCGTMHEARGRGLNQGCIGNVLRSRELQHADAVFTEARIAHTPIIRAMINNDLEFAGILRNHVQIGGDRDLPETGDIESLTVFYAPR